MFREFQLRHGLKPISSDLEEMIVDTKNYHEFIQLLNKAFPLEKIATVFFSSTKDLNYNGLNDLELTKVGLHVFRRWSAQLAHKKRTDSTIFEERGIDTYTFDNNDVLENVMKEFDGVKLSVNKQSNNIIMMNQKELPTLFNLHISFFDKIIPNISLIMSNEILAKYNHNTFAQRVLNKPDDNDNQKLYHIDTFFPAIKWWWFPEEVKETQGAFWYAEKSCNLTESMLDWLYIESLKCVTNNYEKWKGKDHKEGSFRASKEDIEKMGFDVKPVVVSPNTLVIGNVSGFHRRGDTLEPTIRNAIHGSIRLDNPFRF